MSEPEQFHSCPKCLKKFPTIDRKGNTGGPKANFKRHVDACKGLRVSADDLEKPKPAIQEACQLFIEQEIQEGLAQGKTPYNIGKDLSAWLEKLFETKIPPRTLEQKARREAAPATNVAKAASPEIPSEIKQKAEPSVFPATSPGRPPKYKPEPEPEPFTDAIHWAIMAINQLENIKHNDPKREEALRKVLNWVNEELK